MNMRKQRLMGLALVLIAAAVVALASTGEPGDQDATAALLVGPLGIYMMVTKSYVLYDGELVESEEDEHAENNH